MAGYARAMEWPAEFYARLAGRDCPACAEGRPDATEWGVRYFAGTVCDAYLVRADVQRGLSIAVWRGRHVAEPTRLSDAEAGAYGREVLAVGRALEAAFAPI
jgi:diadenosine tetraphosphate (Ap4A) HIT family hydrolase